MRETFVNEMLIVAVASFVMFLPIWLLLWIVFPKLDRRPKDSIRCRTCSYDLRATSADDCPECGADLTKTKVWPPGKPNRGKLVHFIMAWAWLGFLATIVASNLYSEHKQSLFKHYTIDQDVVILSQPESATHDVAFITLSGQRWVVLPGKHEDLSIPVTWASIHIFAAGTRVLSVAIDLETMTYMPHPLAYVENDQAGIRQTSGVDLPYGQSVTAEGLADFYPLGLSRETDERLIQEMAQIIEALQQSKTKGSLLWSPEETQSFAAELQESSETTRTYAVMKGLKYNYEYDTKEVPMWTTFLVLGLGVFVTGLGVFWIRRWCYRRDLIAWAPAREDQPG